jgi:DNA-binding NarL/FixJ family response regulator
MLVRRLLIVDEQPLFRQGICAVMEDFPQFRVVGDVDAAHQALQLTMEARPHVALVSHTLPGLTGMTLISSLAAMRLPCAAVAMVSEITPGAAQLAREAGAAGIVSRAVDPAELATVLHRCLAKSSTVSQAANLLPLSTRELEILDCVAQGYSNREIAEALFVTEKTVKNHMTSVFRKLDVEDRVQALLTAVRRGWVTFGNQATYDSGTRRTA